MLCAAPSFLAAQETDEEGCKDHPLFNRMKGFVLYSCESNFDAVEFYVGEDQAKTLEGQKTVLGYSLPEGRPAPSELQVLRNFISAAQAAGGKVVYQSDIYVSLQIVKGGGEVWVAVDTANGGTFYTLTILEVGTMAQEITAGDMLAALEKDGRIALEIHFDTGKATIRPESERIVGEIAALLKQSPDLRVSIEGHTDNTGTPRATRRCPRRGPRPSSRPSSLRASKLRV
ncbi:MAG: OmpA family protein [Candidatus Moduliflexus flocculans]|nr:OmpA family protein [Candidatus Moduliflexus flocculans]